MDFECNHCGLVSDDEALFVTRSDRTLRVRRTCRQCSRIRSRGYMKTSRAKRRAQLDSIKDVPCADCGVRYPPYVMDFDHRGDKSFNIGDALSDRTMQELVIEAGKCDVVCANCHRIRTHARFQYVSGR